MFTAHATREPPERPPGQLSRVRPETGHVRDRGPLRGVPLEEGQQGTQYNSIPVTRHIFAFQASKQITTRCLAVGVPTLNANNSFFSGPIIKPFKSMKVKTIRICLVYGTPCEVIFFSINDHRDF